MNAAERARSILSDELTMLGHQVADLPAAALMADGTQVVVIAQGDGSVRIAFDDSQYNAAPAAIHWPLLVSTISAVAIQNRKPQETKP